MFTSKGNEARIEKGQAVTLKKTKNVTFSNETCVLGPIVLRNLLIRNGPRNRNRPLITNY